MFSLVTSQEKEYSFCDPVLLTSSNPQLLPLLLCLISCVGHSFSRDGSVGCPRHSIVLIFPLERLDCLIMAKFCYDTTIQSFHTFHDMYMYGIRGYLINEWFKVHLDTHYNFGICKKSFESSAILILCTYCISLYYSLTQDIYEGHLVNF